MRNLYDELRSLVNPAEPADKNSVLAGAVSLIQDLRDENTKLHTKVHVKEKKLQSGDRKDALHVKGLAKEIEEEQTARKTEPDEAAVMKAAVKAHSEAARAVTAEEQGPAKRQKGEVE